jgi:hypothetical protein
MTILLIIKMMKQQTEHPRKIATEYARFPAGVS